MEVHSRVKLKRNLSADGLISRVRNSSERKIDRGEPILAIEFFYNRKKKKNPDITVEIINKT